MMKENNSLPTFDPQEFDIWAPGYDTEANRAAGFPFGGYHDVLDEVMRLADATPGMRVLDLGTGTGNLAMRFHALGCSVWGTDFSVEMLLLARQKAPQITFIQADLRSAWPVELELQFDRIVSAYVFHHFTLPHKVGLVAELIARLSPSGRIVIADLSFPTAEHLAQARQKYQETWDEEDYWLADQALPALRSKNWQVSYRQVSDCAGVYCFQPTI